MKILSIFFVFLFISNLAFGQQNTPKEPRFSFKLGLNTTLTRFSRINSDIPEHWPGASSPIGLLNPIFGFGKGWELSLPILVLNQRENWKSLNGELIKVDGRLQTNYQIGIGIERVKKTKRKLWNMPISWGIGANTQVSKFTFEAVAAPVFFLKVTKQVAIEWFTGPRVLIKQWKHVFLDAQAYLVVRSNWNSIDFYTGGDSRIIEPVAAPIRLQPRLGLGYRW